MTRGRHGLRLVLMGSGALLGLLVSELGLRGYLSLEAARKAAQWQSVGESRRVDGPVELGQIIRPHAERKISYELIPNLDVTFKGARVQTNTSGFRGPTDPEWPAPGAERPVRLVGLGDSVMFGWGVKYEECFLSLLGQELAASRPGAVVEVINTGVPGYNTVMEVETLALKGLAYEPDVILIDHVGNDLQPPHFIPRDVDYWTLSRSFLFDLARAALRGERFEPFSRFGPPPRLGADREFWETGEFDLDDVPEGLRDMVGLGAFRAAMLELADLAREHGFRVVVTTHMQAPGYLREVCLELGFPLVETSAVLEPYMREHGIEDRGASALALSASDPHPTALAHRLQAQAILRDPEVAEIFRQVLADRGGD